VFVASAQKQRKKPVNRRLQGMGGGMELLMGWRRCWSGHLGVSWTWKWWGQCFVAIVHRVKKKKLVNVSLHGYYSFTGHRVLV